MITEKSYQKRRKIVREILASNELTDEQLEVLTDWNYGDATSADINAVMPKQIIAKLQDA